MSQQLNRVYWFTTPPSRDPAVGGFGWYGTPATWPKLRADDEDVQPEKQNHLPQGSQQTEILELLEGSHATQQ